MRVRKSRHYLLGILLMLVVGFAVWSRRGRQPPKEPIDLHLLEIRCFNEDAGNGNLLGIQPYMVPADYASEERFYRKLDGYFAEARKSGFIADKTVVVLPEYLSVWLVVAGEKQSVYRARTINDATAILIVSNLLSFLRWLPFAKALERAKCALFQMKAKSMAAIYQRAFSRLASEYRVTIVAGSLFLANPRVTDGVLVAGRGPLYNVSVVYGPDGRALTPLVRKAFPTEEELRYVSAGPVEEIPVFQTPAGRLGVLICADSWYPQAYRVLKEKGVDIIAVPSFLYPEGGWEEKWRGYSGARPPDDVGSGDVQGMKEGEAWTKYALPGRISESGARAGINVFLRGDLWDLGSDGQAIAVTGGRTCRCPRVDGAAIINLWLNAAPAARQKQDVGGER